MGQRIQVEWRETAAELKQLYKQERHPQRRTRLQALWHLRQGDRIREVVEKVGVAYRSVQNWLRWYRRGGLREVGERVTGYQSAGAEAYLNALQQRALAAKVELGEFRTVWDAVQWVEDRWKIRYSYHGMYALLKRHDLHIKVPRPRSDKADPQQQEAWKKGA
jgi:transposase